ncbi:hypothetical protein ACFSKI_04025 [Pseudogracilibacillus auburnensis]|uniref:Integral membrane protein n=1 Tax=Pseudogracilibacillus auburnensis TaxID=1494959 RepID=A0A2V3W0T0_9BACI|nr:hypothetical protein [Pseudogracilibacillus auburnensis]PXW87923.1 hypothetical protein DFR56_10471 [Pseudogracilibacillus auburnensis]
MEFLLKFQWEIFIFIEVLSVVSLLLFGIVRYLMNKKKLSFLFIGAFLMLLVLEALLAVVLYQETGEISTFQIVITIFVLYACTFGIADFKKLDRWMRKKIGGWRGEELLTDKDYQIIEQNKNPKYLARKYRWTSTAHLIVFVIVQFIFWKLGTANIEELVGYARDLSWMEAGTYENSPYPNETLYAIGMLWGIIFVVDFIWSWSYTIFPSKGK